MKILVSIKSAQTINFFIVVVTRILNFVDTLNGAFLTVAVSTEIPSLKLNWCHWGAKLWVEVNRKYDQVFQINVGKTTGKFLLNNPKKIVGSLYR
jgi:hypothetical protein